MSVACLTDTFRASPYTLGTRLVHLALADWANEERDNLLWPSLRTVAEKAKVSTDTVARAIKQMVEDGYLELVGEHDPVTHAPAHYRFIMPSTVIRPLDANCGEPPPEGRKLRPPSPQIAATPPRKQPDHTMPLTQIGTQDLTQPRAREGSSLPFEDFYARYPRKENKPGALRAWKKLNPGPDLEAAIRAGLDAWCPHWQARLEVDQSFDKSKIPHPATWLNGRRWEDDPPPLPRPRLLGRPGRESFEDVRAAGVAALVKAQEATR